MKIAVDGFGGDHAPLSVLEGSAMAVKELGVQVILTGNEQILRKTAEEHQISLEGISLVHTEDVIEVTDPPIGIAREHRDSSMGKAFTLVTEGEAEAFVSAGSTGAVVVGSSLIVRRIKGIKRVAIGTVIPCMDGCYMLVDAGANLECRPEVLVQFARMGAIYMQKIIGIENPRVGLVNVGAEETKGRELQIKAYQLLQESELNFVGNIEGRDIALGGADVVVCDGFAGNLILKTTEGMAKFMMQTIKGVFTQNLRGKLAGAMVLNNMKSLKKDLDYKEYGGAPLLGASKPVIKAHGSSDSYAIKNAIRQAVTCVKQDVVGEMTRTAAAAKENSKTAEEQEG